MLWESAGAFFPRDNALVSAGNSHSSGVRGLVVRFSIQRYRVRTGAYALFFYKHSEAERSAFPLFWHHETFPLFGFETFSKIFYGPQRVPFQFATMYGEKSQRAEFRFFGTILIFRKKSTNSLQFFDILQQNGW